MARATSEKKMASIDIEDMKKEMMVMGLVIDGTLEACNDSGAFGEQKDLGPLAVLTQWHRLTEAIDKVIS
jgi:hypothetical protein